MAGQPDQPDAMTLLGLTEAVHELQGTMQQYIDALGVLAEIVDALHQKVDTLPQEQFGESVISEVLTVLPWWRRFWNWMRE